MLIRQDVPGGKGGWGCLAATSQTLTYASQMQLRMSTSTDMPSTCQVCWWLGEQLPDDPQICGTHEETAGAAPEPI